MFIKIKPQNKLTALFFALLCAGGLGLFGISLNPAVPFPFVAQGLGVLLLVFGVVLCTKFILRTLYYSIQPAGIFDADGNEIEYTIEEINPPPAWSPHYGEIRLKSGQANAYETTITNVCTLIYELPETGGTGTPPYTLAGLLIISAAGILLLYRYRFYSRKEGDVAR